MVNNVAAHFCESDSGSDSKYSSGDNEQEEEVDEKKEIDRRIDGMAGVYQVFGSQVLAVYHKNLATEKRQIVIDLVRHTVETLFCLGPS